MGSIDELRKDLDAKSIRSTYVWMVSADDEMVDWYHGSLEFVKKQLEVTFPREVHDPANKGKEVLGELFYVDDQGRLDTVPGDMHSIGH